MILLLSTLALAAPPQRCEEAATVEELDWLLGEAKKAVAGDEFAAHGEIYRRIQQRLPCLEQPISVEAWAGFLYGEAIIEWNLGLEWEEPLTTALRIRPHIKRTGPEEVAVFTPLLPPDDLPTLPEDAKYWVNGLLSTVEPPTDGLQLVQREFVGVWDAKLLRSEEMPAAWRVDRELSPEEEPKRKGLPPAVRIVSCSAAGVGAASWLGGYLAGKRSAANGNTPAYRTARTVNIVGGGVAVGGGLACGASFLF